MYYTTLNKSIVALYYISWIFIGNFILLNLFLAILLDSFLVEDEEEEEQSKQEEEKRKELEIKNQNKNSKYSNHKPDSTR